MRLIILINDSEKDNDSNRSSQPEDIADCLEKTKLPNFQCESGIYDISCLWESKHYDKNLRLNDQK